MVTPAQHKRIAVLGQNAQGPTGTGLHGLRDAVRSLGRPGTVPFDIKGIFGKQGSDLRL